MIGPQVHDRQVSLFLDGLEEDGTPFDTRPLTSALRDVQEDSTMRVGLSSNGRWCPAADTPAHSEPCSDTCSSTSGPGDQAAGFTHSEVTVRALGRRFIPSEVTVRALGSGL